MYKNNVTDRGFPRPGLPVLISLLLGGGVRWRAFFGVLFACLAAAASVGLVGLSGWFIAASAFAGMSGAATFIVAYPSSGIRAFAVVRVVFRYLERLTNHRVTFSLLSRMRVHFFERALAVPAARFSRYRSGDLLNRATSDVDALDNAFPRVIVPTVAAVVVCAGSVAFLAYHSLLLAAILGVGCLVAGGALPFVSAAFGRGSGARMTRAKAGLRTEVVEAVEGLPEIRSYGAGRVVAARLEGALDGFVRDERSAKTTDAAGTSSGNLVAQLTTLAVLVAGLVLYQSAGLAGPILALVVLLSTGVFEQLGALPAAYRALGVTRAAAERLSEIFQNEEDERDEKEPPSGEDFPLREDGKGAGISVREAVFCYEGRRDLALDDVSLEAEAGSLTALVGPSGSGKTTLLGLLGGELRPDSGDVEMGGIPVGKIHPESLFGHVAYASQDDHIFDETLRENLHLAAPEVEDDVLLYVLDIVGLAGFYEGLEDGLDTRLGEHGREISGGQRRRISVARALLRRPDVLLLDEPTGSLNDETARHMIRAIRENLPRATVVIATHDPRLVTAAVPESRIFEIS